MDGSTAKPAVRTDVRFGTSYPYNQDSSHHHALSHSSTLPLCSIFPSSSATATKKESFYSEKEDKDEQKEFETGPLSILMNSVKQNTQVDTR